MRGPRREPGSPDQRLAPAACTAGHRSCAAGTKPDVWDVQMNNFGTEIGGGWRSRACSRATRVHGIWTAPSRRGPPRLRARRWRVVIRERVWAVLGHAVNQNRSRASPRYLYSRLAPDLGRRGQRQDAPGISPRDSHSGVRHLQSAVQETSVNVMGASGAGNGNSLTDGSLVQDIVIPSAFVRNVAMRRSRGGMERLPAGRIQSSKHGIGR
jgi:hypothetical protein